MDTLNENRYQENGINFYIITYSYYKNGKNEGTQWHCISSRNDLATTSEKLKSELVEKLLLRFPEENHMLEVVNEHSYAIYKELFVEMGGTHQAD